MFGIGKTLLLLNAYGAGPSNKVVFMFINKILYGMEK